jgi:hypothetical protein
MAWPRVALKRKEKMKLKYVIKDTISFNKQNVNAKIRKWLLNSVTSDDSEC